LLLIAVLFTTAQADYLGPNRVIVTYETIYQRQACRFVDVRDPAGPGVCACTMTVYTSPTGSCPGSVDSHYFHTDVCGWSSENPDCTDAGLDSISGPSSSIQSCSLGDQACTAVVIEHRTTLAAATVSGAITCSTPGQNGWCIGPAVLNVSGSEPLSGYSILTIEGTRNSESFACPGDHCSNVPLSEGSNDFQFWAISSYGDSSAMGSASASVDTQAPTISGSLSGTQGENGWYTSAVTLSAAATDPTPGSGIASFEVSADGAAWQPCSGSLTLGDGVHTVSLRTADAAGWTASAEQTFSVDTQAPQLSADLAGHLVSPGRYNTTATLSASGSDTGSGLNRIEYQDNSGGWTTYTDPLVFYNGQHEIEVRAVDQAGLTSDVQTFSFFVESHGPYITVPDHWQVGQTISLSVQANSFSLGSVSIVVSDPQQRWPDVEQVYPAAGDSFTTDFHWDGQFNGQTAPAGQYTVSVYASDVMSNLSVSHSQVTVPVVIPTAVPTLTATGTTAAAATVTAQPSSTPTAVAAGVPVTSFSSPASPVTQPVATLPSNVLWGGAAAAVIGAATAAALEAARKRKEEEEAQRKAAEAAAAQFNAAEKVIDAQIAANQDSQWLMQQWLGSQGLPMYYPTQAALVAAYDAAREAEKQKAKEQEALNDAYQSFKQADQQSMQEYEAYQGEQEKHASSNGNKKANSISPSLKVLNDIKPVEIGNENEPPAEGCSWYEIWNSCWWKNVGNSIMNAFSSTSNQVVWGKTTPTSTPTAIPTPTKTLVPTTTMSATHTPEVTPTPNIYERSSLLDNVNLYQGILNAPKMLALPFDGQFTAPYWGFYDTNFAKDHCGQNQYSRTKCMHSGIDWGLPFNTPLKWTFSEEGVVTSITDGNHNHPESDQTINAGAGPSNILIQTGNPQKGEISILVLYGHLSNVPADLHIGDIVDSGEIIGYSGNPTGSAEDGNNHLHFEIRPDDPNYPPNQDGLNTGTYINPLTVMEKGLLEEQYEVFQNLAEGGDYPIGSGPLDCGWYSVKPEYDNWVKYCPK